MKRLVFLGDSITDCGKFWGDFNKTKGLGQGYVSIIDDKLSREYDGEYTVINQGFDGMKTSDMIFRWEQIYPKEEIYTATILIGVNDALNGEFNDKKKYINDYKHNLCDILQKICESNAHNIVIMSPFIFTQVGEFADWDSYIKEYIQISYDISKKYNTSYIDLYESFKKELRSIDYRKLTVDGIHPTRKGQEVIANIWLNKNDELHCADCY